jgi:hypothetical protein
MRQAFIIIVFYLLISLNLRAQEAVRINFDYTELDFRGFVSRAESTTGLKFFYKDEWVGNLKSGDVPGATSVQDLLNRLFEGESLYFFIDEAGNVVITKSFQVKTGNVPDDADKKFIAPSEFYDSGEKGKVSGNVVFEIGNPSERTKPGSVPLTGYITNRDTKEPVPGVTVYVQKLQTGAISNEYGFYSITLPRGGHLVQFSYIGMKEKSVSINMNSAGEMNVEMNSVLIPLKETVVTAQRSMTLQRFEVGLEKINITTFKLMPSLMGEADLLKSVLMLPGINTVGDGSAGFNVRGGSADQNLVLLYGAPVYNTTHFFGFFSSVNSDIIRDATMYKGGIPGRFGGRLSSVLDISAKEGNRNKFAGNAGISPVTTHLMLEGPIIKDKLTYLLTARTTYSNYLLHLIDNPALNNSSASFYDVNGKITWDASKKDKIDLNGYYSNDAFRFNSDTVYRYSNAVASARWRHFFNSRFFSMVTVYNSSYNYDISSEGTPTEGFSLTHKVNTTGAKGDFNLYQGRHEMNFGAELMYHNILPGKYYPAGDSSLVVPDKIDNESGIETAIYFEDKYSLTDYLSVNAGLRFSSFSAIGPASVMIYEPGYSKSISTIADTLQYGNGEIYQTYGGPELRLSMNFKLSTRQSLKLNYNRTRQYIHLLSNTTAISPTDTWKLCDYYVKPQIGDQVALGFYNVFSDLKIEASAEIYYKYMKNVVDFKGGTSLIMNRNVEKDLVNVNGKAYGIEVMMKKTEGRLQWTLGYTYARTWLRSTGTYSDEIINGGDWFPSNYDKPHELIALFNFLMSRRFSFSANYTYSTGRPITYPVTVYYIDGLLMTHYSDRNKYRVPDYSRLDISWRISGNLKSKKIAHPNWIFSIINVLGRQNVYSVYFRNEDNSVKGYKLSVFGQAIPSVTFNFDF